MTDPWTHTFTCPLTGSPDRVFSALTDPGQLRRWFAERVEIEPRQGGAFRFWGRHTSRRPPIERARASGSLGWNQAARWRSAGRWTARTAR